MEKGRLLATGMDIAIETSPPEVLERPLTQWLRTEQALLRICSAGASLHQPADWEGNGSNETIRFVFGLGAKTL